MTFRVRSAIQRKDEMIAELGKSYEKAMEQCKHLEVMLERQTRDNVLGSLNTSPVKPKTHK